MSEELFSRGWRWMELHWDHF